MGIQLKKKKFLSDSQNPLIMWVETKISKLYYNDFELFNNHLNQRPKN